ncbi:MAG: hypothetical protein KDK55_03300, partial [Chlamydiia bacterium]|nr:hypothetical protein [Chlamydiia bacterium]
MKAFKFRFKTVLKVVTIKEREAQRAFFSAKKRMEETIDLKNQLEKEQEATEKFIIKGKNFTSMIAYQEALIIEINLSNVLI